jgi:predicted oxidoreductase
MRFGDWGARLSPAEVARLLATALDLGIDTLDLADIYGGHTTNALVGAALRHDPSLRPRLHLLAKVGIVMPESPGNSRRVQHYDLSPSHLDAALAGTVRDLGVARVDTLMLHRQDLCMDPDAIADWLERQQDRGLIGAFGVSNFNAAGLALFDHRHVPVANQVELSLTKHAVLHDDTHAATLARGAEVQAWSPLGGGELLQRRDDLLAHALDGMAGEFGLDRAGLLLRWVASLPRTRVVLGTTRPERLDEAVRAVASPLPRDAWYALLQAARGHAAQ